MKAFPYFHWSLSTAIVLATLGVGGAAVDVPWVLAKQSDLTEQSQTAYSRPMPTVEEQAYQFLDQGVVKALKGDYQGAIQSYNQSIQLGPTNPMVYYNRGVAFYSMGDTEAALKDFNQAIQLDPNIAEAYGNRGALRLEQQDRKGAIQDFQHAAQLLSQRGDTVAAQELLNWMQQNLLLEPQR